MLHEDWLHSSCPFIRDATASFSLTMSSATGTNTELASEPRLACLCLGVFKYLSMLSKAVDPGTLHRVSCMGLVELVCWNLVCHLTPNVLLPPKVDTSY